MRRSPPRLAEGREGAALRPDGAPRTGEEDLARGQWAAEET